MVESAEKKWYVLHTYAGYENRVKLNIESRKDSMGMSDYIFQVVVPATPEEEKNKDGQEEVKMDKSFPGYVIIQMVMTDQSWYIVRNTPGVTGFIGSHGQGSKPTPLLDSEVELILKRLHQQPKPKKLDVAVGDEVTIIDGAFSGLSGKVTDVDYEKSKLNVDINMFGRDTNTELDFGQVKTTE